MEWIWMETVVVLKQLTSFRVTVKFLDRVKSVAAASLLVGLTFISTTSFAGLMEDLPYNWAQTTPTRESALAEFLTLEFAKRGLMLPSSLLQPFLRSSPKPSIVERASLIKYAARMDFNDLERRLETFEGSQLNSRTLFQYGLHRIERILTDRTVEEILAESDNFLPFNDSNSSSSQVDGADFRLDFLLDYFSERNISYGRFDQYPPPGDMYLNWANEIPVIDEEDQSLKAELKQKYSAASQKLFNELALNLGVATERLTTSESVLNVHKLFELKAKDLFWTIYKKHPFSTQEKKFLDLLYKMRNLQILGKPNIFQFDSWAYQPALTKESFLKGLRFQYENYIKYQVSEKTTESDIKAQRRMLESRIQKTQAKLQKLRCEELF
jgi:hypothetical protein